MSRATRWLGTLGLLLPALAVAQALTPEAPLRQWLQRMQQAAMQQSYVGTVVISGTQGVLRSVRIEHGPGLEPLWALQPRVIDGAGGFYRVQMLGRERVAGWLADRVLLRPVDDWRYGYMVWMESASGLVLKSQTLDARGQVLEQAAFDEVRLEPGGPQRGTGSVGAGAQPLSAAMPPSWRWRPTVPGFGLLACHERPLQAGAAPVRQWVFSDGLASVSVFAQRFDGRQQPARNLTQGATQMVARRLGPWWLTAVGEAPPATLAALLQGLEPQP